MAGVLVDSGIFIPPILDTSRENVKNYSEIIFSLKEFLNNKDINIFMSQNAYQVFYDSGLLNFEKDIEEFYKEYFSAEDYIEKGLSTQIREIFINSREFEKEFCVRDLQFEKVVTTPDISQT